MSELRFRKGTPQTSFLAHLFCPLLQLARIEITSAPTRGSKASNRGRRIFPEREGGGLLSGGKGCVPERNARGESPASHLATKPRSRLCRKRKRNKWHLLHFPKSAQLASRLTVLKGPPPPPLLLFLQLCTSCRGDVSHGWAGRRQQPENTVSGREREEEEEEKAEYSTERRVSRVAGFGNVTLLFLSSAARLGKYHFSGEVENAMAITDGSLSLKGRKGVSYTCIVPIPNFNDAKADWLLQLVTKTRRASPGKMVHS